MRPGTVSPSTEPHGAASFDAVATPFAALDGFAADDVLAAWRAFMVSARAIAAGRAALRQAVAADAALRLLCRSAVDAPELSTPDEARRFFESHFRPFRVVPRPGSGFLTGYYEPVVDGSLERRPDFTGPILARPPGLGRIEAGDAAAPFLDRAAIEEGIEDGRFRPIVWLRDPVEAFFVHVQGSARVRLAGGGTVRLVYDGRNGHPYTSVGRHLVETGRLSADEATMEPLKRRLRDLGQGPGEAGRAVLHRNRSFIFFRMDPAGADLEQDSGPTGGAGVPLTPLRSIAVDRSVWPYGLPIWVEAELPWDGDHPTPFRRLLVAQDTGSAIVGPARADLFFGSGVEAGRRAGSIRHPATMTVLWPRAGRTSPVGGS